MPVAHNYEPEKHQHILDTRNKLQ